MNVFNDISNHEQLSTFETYELNYNIDQFFIPTSHSDLQISGSQLPIQQLP
ncbi:12791_t:CDS:1, partial [Cetraspora pellucida]